MIDLSTRSEYDDTGNSTPRVIPVIRMNRRMNQDFYVKFALFVPVLVSHIQSGSSDGSSFKIITWFGELSSGECPPSFT